MLPIKKSLTAAILTACLTLGSFSSAAAASNVTMSIKDGEIRDVLTALSNLSEQSIVTDESVKGRISIDLDDVPFDVALDLITRTKGLTYKTISNVIVVSSYEQMNKFFSNLGIYKLNYAKAEDVQKSLSGIVKGEGLTIDPITNSIIFTGTRAEEQKLKDAISQLDVATKQITLEAKIISLNNEDIQNFGLVWDWDKLPSPDDSSSGSSSSSNDKFGGILHIGYGYTTRFQATLNALLSNGKAKILATPRIITIPGKEASIFIGDHIPVQTEKRDNGETTTSTEYVDAGIKLSYTPIVSTDGFITSVVHTEVSTPTLIAELKNYKITSRTADTNVRMRDGETLIIGGLINEEEQKNLQAIPILSKLPLIGELFKNRSNTKTKTEVMMILTPHISNPGESPAIYDERIANTRLTPMPDEEKEARRQARLAQARQDEQLAIEANHGKPTMKERAEAILGRNLDE